MINRIVRMSFEPGKEKEFLAVFNEVKESIAGFPGCEGLILLRDAGSPNVFLFFSDQFCFGSLAVLLVDKISQTTTSAEL